MNVKLPLGKVLQKDIIIPKGTVFFQEPSELIKQYFGNDNYTFTIGLTDDTSGELTYCIDKDDAELSAWFKDYDPNEKEES
jgi:hypothetical protein